jgi:hypothetical protein
MAAFKTTLVVTLWAHQPTIVQRFLSTSAFFLFNPAVAVSARIPTHPERPTAARAAQ